MKLQVRIEIPIPRGPVRLSLADRCPGRTSEDVEHQQQDEGQQGGDEQRAETAQPVREEEEHPSAMPTAAGNRTQRGVR